MLFQTVINHEVNVKSFSENFAVNMSNMQLNLTLSIKNDSRVLNNTITLKNFIRTSEAFRQYVAENIVTRVSVPFKSFNVVEQHYPSMAFVSPVSNGKMTIILSIRVTEEFKNDPMTVINELLKGI